MNYGVFYYRPVTRIWDKTGKGKLINRSFAYPTMHWVWRPICRYFWCNTVSDQRLHWKYFTFATDLQVETHAELKSILFCKIDYVNSWKYFGRWLLVKNMKKRLNFWSLRRLSVHIFYKSILASIAHKRITLVTLVLYKGNVAAKHGSSKPLTTNELWLLELRIKSTRTLAPIPDALWDMCKFSILCLKATAHTCFQWAFDSAKFKL